MGISGNLQSLSQLRACYGVPRVTRGFPTLFTGEKFAVYLNQENLLLEFTDLYMLYLANFLSSVIFIIRMKVCIIHLYHIVPYFMLL